ncbi:hypothetical protein C4N9_05255 [Pararhodobacter marinus]|uniref:Tellurium resistance protein n=1 Tax=Pararhodobacter marinus TaxID=2184063 RepID=A0A2U2CE52_9RHOB|nr:TrgA family protein [Pararhodobacter marinus]PWE30111.1 hypothetical protein C4N9_05255 [Pararhodobacter marinus]
MFTLIRPIAAILLGVFGYFAAKGYEPLFDPLARMGAFAVWTAGISALIGWLFVGGRIGRALWFSIYIVAQGIVLSALVTAMVMGVREVFILGFRRRYGEVMDALTGYIDIIIGWLKKALVQEYLIFLGAGAVVIGIVLHVIWRMMERRRNAR